MNILFLHRNFPAQFRHLVFHLMKDKKNKVAFLTNSINQKLDGIITGVYELQRQVDKNAHRYLKEYEESIIHGQSAARISMKLKDKGFYPDIIFGHSWGPISFMKDVFPDVPLIGYFEWFYNSKNSDVDFGRKGSPSIDSQAKIRIKNSHLLVDLYSCDGGVSPTLWQKHQFPKEYHDKLETIHDGIDTDFFKPETSRNGLNIPEIGLHIPADKPIVTYATRGMEPYRGFPQFMEAASLLLKERPDCHVVISGKNQVSYGPKPPNGKTFKELMLEKFDYDMSRLHFTGFLSYPNYLKVLQASTAHVYLSVPFVLSWSLLESMAAGCSVIASDTPPVAEVVKDGHNGFLVDFFSPHQLAVKVMEVIDKKKDMDVIGSAARQTVQDNYHLPACRDKQLAYLRRFLN